MLEKLNAAKVIVHDAYMTSVGHRQQELLHHIPWGLPFSPCTHRIPNSVLTFATIDIEILYVSRFIVGQAPKLHTPFIELTWHVLLNITKGTLVRDHHLLNSDKMPKIECALAPFSEILKNPPNLINLVDAGNFVLMKFVHSAPSSEGIA